MAKPTGLAGRRALHRLHQRTKDYPSPHYVGWWKGTKNASDQVEDFSGNGNHLSRKSGLSASACFDTRPGWITTQEDATGLKHIYGAANLLDFEVLDRKSLLLAFWGNASVGGRAAISNVDGFSIGWNVNLLVSTSITVRVEDDLGNTGACTFSNATALGADTHTAILIDAAYDGGKGRIHLWKNGVQIAGGSYNDMSDIADSTSPAGAEFSLGGNLVSGSGAWQFRDIHALIIPGSVNIQKVDRAIAKLYAATPGTYPLRQYDTEG
jgi:hypothetical protein